MLDKLIDIVIPVYNAPEVTKEGIDSIYKHLKGKFGTLYIHEDNSPNKDVRKMLEALTYPALDIYFSPVNQGFPGAVNAGVSRSSAPYILILNSDILAEDDFLSPILDVIQSDHSIAAVNVAGERYAHNVFSMYKDVDGFVESNKLSGYAFLIRRKAFDDVGGFNTLYGRGYFEDDELSRNLMDKGWKIGIHKNTSILHKHQGSFKSIKAVDELIAANRKMYYERYPEARRRILVVGGCECWDALSESISEYLNLVVRNGGLVLWMSPISFLLPNKGFKFVRNSILRMRRLVKKSQKNRYKKITEVVFLSSCNPLKKYVAKRMLKRTDIRVLCESDLNPQSD